MAHFFSCKEKINEANLDNRDLLPGFTGPAGQAITASVLLQLENLQPTEHVAEKIKAYLEEKM